MKQAFLITIGAFGVAAIFINSFLNDPSFENLSDKASYELQSNQPELADQTYLEIVLQDSFSIENHYNYIGAHFEIPHKISKNNYRNDTTIIGFYNTLAESPDSNLADIGFYGKGLIQVNFENYDVAISHFLQVKNKNLKYLNNSIGNAYLNIDSTHAAEYYFKQEIKNNGNVEGAYTNLIELLADQNRTAELNNYFKNSTAKQYFPTNIEQTIYFQTGQVKQYITFLLKRVFSGLNIWGATAAFLIMISWIIYFRKIDIFEEEKWKHIIITVLLGMLFSFFVFPMSNFINSLGFKLNDDVVNDFFYCIVGIGAVEELVKIIPLLLMMKFTKAVNEPFDYIKYASLSALGFAFVENLIYFHESNLHIIHGRALTAVVSHMFDSSLIAYGIILNKYKTHKNPYLNFILFFALAAFAHGFYDFWLINKTVHMFSIVTILFMVSCMFAWNSFKNNALNHSEFYDQNKSVDTDKIR